MIISEAQREQYRRDGYFLLECAIPPTVLEGLREECGRLVAEQDAQMEAKGVQTQGIRGHEITRAISDSTPITVRAILPVGCEHTSDLSASHPARRPLYDTEAECSLRDGVADRRLCPLPGSWTTLAYMPRSSTPGGPPAPGHFRTGDVVFRWINVDSALALARLYHAACTLSVYASQPGVAPGPRNTRFRLVANLDRSGLSPAGSHRRFPACLSVYMAFVG